MALAITLIATYFIICGGYELVTRKIDSIYTHFEHRIDNMQDHVRELEIEIEKIKTDLNRSRNDLREELHHCVIDWLDEMTNKNLKEDENIAQL